MRVQFGTCTLDSESRQLVRDGVAIHLSPKAFDLLCYLVEKRPAAVTKEDLHTRIWPGTFVVDANLTVVIAELRRALGDDPQNPHYIRTIHRVGYAFCAPAVSIGDAPANTPHKAWLAWNDRVLALREGENLIGRDPACGVWLDLPGVSRRHARIVVRGETASLDDLGSTNGTFIGTAPVTASQPIRDGDVIHIGSAALRFRLWSESRPVATERLAR
jgi:DNA-binding winged helix-turn-helix (wHTH) protein